MARNWDINLDFCISLLCCIQSFAKVLAVRISMFFSDLSTIYLCYSIHVKATNGRSSAPKFRFYDLRHIWRQTISFSPNSKVSEWVTFLFLNKLHTAGGQGHAAEIWEVISPMDGECCSQKRGSGRKKLYRWPLHESLKHHGKGFKHCLKSEFGIYSTYCCWTSGSNMGSLSK